MQVTIDFKLDRERLRGIEGQTDKQVVIEWVSRVLSVSHGGEPLNHLINESVVRAMEAGAENFTLTPLQFLAVQVALCRAAVPGDSTRAFTQILNKFGLELPAHDPQGNR